MTIGRSPTQDIVVLDTSASRLHAEIYHDEQLDSVTLTDLGSTNGTFVNREKLTVARRLYDGDVIRIGASTLEVTYRDPDIEPPKKVTGSKRVTRELVLEALDHHAVLLYEVAHQLNMVTDLATALSKVTDLMQKAMGADKCEVILAENFDELEEMGFPISIAEDAIRGRSTIVVPDVDDSPYGKEGQSSLLLNVKSALCVPVMSGKEEVIALLYLYKSSKDTRPFDERDMQLSVAISHQASLTIQRMHLLAKIEQEQRGRLLLQRFLSPQEAEFVLQDYLETGYLPPLDEREVSILFADIQDSTGLSERLGAKAFGEILNRYYWDITDMIFEYGGLVRYAGDGIMAVFGMTDGRDDHGARAIQAGIAMLDHIDATDFETDEEIIIGVGVKTGMAAIGYVGTQQRVELTALGYTVNVAHALQLLARPNKLFVSPETAVNVAGKLPLRDLGMIGLKGSEQKFHAYEVLRQPKKAPKIIEL